MNTDIFKRFNALATDRFRPIQASLELTNRCNERCTHCYIDEFKDEPGRILSLQEWFKILDELRSAGTLYLILMGGEPLLSPYFYDITQRGRELGFHVSMISNGLKIKNLDSAEHLRDSGLLAATFSLYSLDPEIHDQMTQVRGAHEKLMAAIGYCDEAGIEVNLNGLLTEANAPGIFDLYDWSVKKGFELKVDPNVTPKLSGNDAPLKYRASRETLLWFYRERSRRYPSSTPNPISYEASDFICNAAKGKCAVTAYGELLPCIEIRESFGSLVESSFSEIWYSDLAKKWRDPKVDQLGEDGKASLYSFCDHCPGMAKNEHGKAFELTSYTKLIAQVKEQVYQESLKSEQWNESTL